MKITILSTAFPLRGGISHFIGLLYNELARNNEVSVITFKTFLGVILNALLKAYTSTNRIEA